MNAFLVNIESRSIPARFADLKCRRVAMGRPVRIRRRRGGEKADYLLSNFVLVLFGGFHLFDAGFEHFGLVGVGYELLGYPSCGERGDERKVALNEGAARSTRPVTC